MRRLFYIKNQYFREFLAEVLGTFFLCLIGLGGNAQYFFSIQSEKVSPLPLQPAICFGAAITISCLLVQKVSGAHLNPAVSFAFFLVDKMSGIRFLIYVIAQMVGAFLGALVVYLNYYDALNKLGLENGLLSINSARIFTTFPKDYVSISSAFFDQVIGTTILIIAILAITDKFNEKYSVSTTFLMIGLVVTIHGLSFTSNCGGAINPARDLSPRILLIMAGWGDKVFTYGNYFFWIPVIGPMVGSALGTFTYYICIGNNWQ